LLNLSDVLISFLVEDASINCSSHNSNIFIDIHIFEFCSEFL